MFSFCQSMFSWRGTIFFFWCSGLREGGANEQLGLAFAFRGAGMFSKQVQVSILAKSFLHEARGTRSSSTARGGYGCSCKIVNVPNIFYCSLDAPITVPATRLLIVLRLLASSNARGPSKAYEKSQTANTPRSE